MTIKITLVTPVLNGEKFIDETIQSVISQAGDFYIDYIIADGGSTDATVTIIKKYDELIKEKKITVFCKGITFRWWSRKDGGQTQALNSGFKEAQGEIFGWINADDYLESDAVQKITTAFCRFSQADVIHGSMFVRDDTKNKKYSLMSRPLDYKVLSQDNYINQPSAFFTKKVFDEVNGFDDSLQYVFDYDFFIKVSQIAKFQEIPDILSTFRIWERSKTYSQDEKFKEERVILARRYNLKRINQNLFRSISSSFPIRVFKKYFPDAYSYARACVNKINAR